MASPPKPIEVIDLTIESDDEDQEICSSDDDTSPSVSEAETEVITDDEIDSASVAVSGNPDKSEPNKDLSASQLPKVWNNKWDDESNGPASDSESK